MSSNIIRPNKFSRTLQSLEPLTTELEPYLKDESKLTSSGALGLFRPKNNDELSGLLNQLSESKSKITFSGARTGLTGGCVPDADAYIVSLERLKGLVSADLEKKEITVRCGTTLSEINELTAQNLPDYFFPIDPTEQSASIGGAVALNAGGARSLRFGSVRSWVVGLKVFMADGSELSLRRGEYVANAGEFILEDHYGKRSLKVDELKKPATKNTIGYFYEDGVDLVDLLVGSEGSLAVVSEVTLRLEKVPFSFISHLQIFKSVDIALKSVEFLRSSKEFPPYSVELIDERSIKSVLEKPKPGIEKFTSLLNGATAAVFIEVPLNSDEELIEFSEKFFEFLIENDEDPEKAISGTDARTLAEIKKIRHLVPERMNEIVAERKKTYPGLHKVSMDMAVPDSELNWVYNLYESELTKLNLEFAIYGHAGNNHFHVNMLPKNMEELELAKKTYLEFAEKIVAKGGAVAAEHGIGRLKKKFLQAQYTEKDFESFKKIKLFFDPENRLNSHVLV